MVMGTGLVHLGVTPLTGSPSGTIHTRGVTPNPSTWGHREGTPPVVAPWGWWPWDVSLGSVVSVPRAGGHGDASLRLYLLVTHLGSWWL